MNPNYFNVISEGLRGELELLSNAEALLHLENYRSNFLLDLNLAQCYLNRFASRPEDASVASKAWAIEYLAGKCLQFSPFSLPEIHSQAMLAEPFVRLKYELLLKTNFEAETLKMIKDLDLSSDLAEVREFARKLLEIYPNYALAAELLLAADYAAGELPDWLDLFDCPRALQDDFNSMLFRHFAGLKQSDEALRIFNRLPPKELREVNLNFAAEAAQALGHSELAVNYYERSLALDPSQASLIWRLGELRNPSRKTPGVLEKYKLAVCIYSYNKAKMLEKTLAGLAKSRLGGARIILLLNGCTDQSRDVAKQAARLFPQNEFSVVELPVNIGAPAARNWLISQASVQESDFTAFLDDDVDVPDDWLEWYVSVAESDPNIGVVGGKIVYPGSPALLQYLFRYVGLAGHDLLKMSLHVPPGMYDNGCYDFIRETRSVMGCLHLFNSRALREVPGFDIRFSPSQVDDIDHDLLLCLAGYKVMYCGLVSCVHHQNSGITNSAVRADFTSLGNAIGNDVKLFYKHFNRLDELGKLDNLSLLPAGPGKPARRAPEPA